jgi:putative glutamine amidotransferase
MTPAAPLVGIPADFRILAGTGVHIVDDPYLRVVSGPVGAVPLILPALAEDQDWPALLASLDGLLITGSQSNVAPERYGGPAFDPGVMLDTRRDASTLPLIPAAVAAGVPLLAICRGFQEMNVAYGGSLHQKLHALPGRIDHRAKPGAPLDVAYGFAHSVHFTAGGLMRALTGNESDMVNSVHWQGVDRLGAGLEVEAVAEDGTIEAVRVADASCFALGVQWHPEHRPLENPVSRAIFAAFADALRQRRARRVGGAP